MKTFIALVLATLTSTAFGVQGSQENQGIHTEVTVDVGKAISDGLKGLFSGSATSAEPENKNVPKNSNQSATATIARMLESNLACKVLDPSGLENSLKRAGIISNPAKPPVGGERVYDVKSDITSFGLKPLRISLYGATGSGLMGVAAIFREPLAEVKKNLARAGVKIKSAKVGQMVVRKSNGYGNTDVICLSDEGYL